MKKIFTLVIFSVISLGFGKTSAQQFMNLDAPSGARFTLTERVWPENHGQADVCLWNDDMIAATSITIDDNIENQHAWWRSMATKYGLKFTWFVIDENVSDWSSFQTLKDEGHDIQGHDQTNWDPDNSIEPSDADYKAQLEETRDAVNGNVTGANCVTYAYPDGKGNEDVARTVFISMRGTHGTMNKANEINYLELESASTNPTDDDKLAADKARLDVLLDSAQTLWNVVYYRGWSCVHFHTVSDLTRAEDYLAYVGTKTDSIWVGGYSEIAKYGQSRDTHTLNVTSVKTDEIKFSLTDQMDDNYFDFPLTVKIRVNNTWNAVSATQNGQAVEAMLITNADGNKYVLVKAVPDAGETIVTGTLDASTNTPPVLNAIGNQSVTEGETLIVNISASDADGDALSFSAVNLSGFASLTDNGDGTATLTLTPDYGNAGVYNGISIAVSDGTESDSEGIIITVNQAATQILNVISAIEDNSVYSPGTVRVDTTLGWVNQAELYVGGGVNWEDNTDKYDMAAVMPFEVPAIESGKKITSATLKVNLNNVVTWANQNYDLYGLPFRNDPTVTKHDYYQGVYGGDDIAFAIQKAFATKDTPVGNHQSSTEANQDFIDYLNLQILKGATSGDFVFLRVNVDVDDAPDYGRIDIDSRDAADAANYPTLSLTVEDISGNSAPLLDKIGNQEVSVGSIKKKNLWAGDFDEGDILSFSLSNQPDFVTLNDNGDGSAELIIEPQNGDEGNYNNIVVTVSDNNGNTDTETINITIINPNEEYVILYPSEEDGAVFDASITKNNPYSLPWSSEGIRLGQFNVDGDAENTAEWSSVIFPFQLPEIPTGKTLTSASFKVYVNMGTKYVNYIVDLYGLQYRSAPEIQVSDYYTGDFKNNEGSNIGIVNSFFTTNAEGALDETARWEETSESEDISLTDYIQAQYDAGGVAGDWIFLRLSLEPTSTGWQRWGIDDATMTNKPSLTLTFKKNTATAVKKPETVNSVSLYPNPTTGTFNVKFDGFDGDVTVSVLSMQGSVLYSRSVSGSQRTVSVDSNLPAGTYIVVLRDKNKVATKKLIVK